DAVVTHDLLERGEEAPLRGEVLDDRLDHHVAGRQRLQPGGDLDAADRGVSIGGLHAALLDHLAERGRDGGARLFRRAGLRIEEERARTGLGEHLGDASAHGAGADDAGGEVAAGGIEHGKAPILAGARGYNPRRRSQGMKQILWTVAAAVLAAT